MYFWTCIYPGVYSYVYMAFEQKHKSKPGPEDQFLLPGYALVSCFLGSWLSVFLFWRFILYLAETLHVSGIEELMIS